MRIRSIFKDTESRAGKRLVGVWFANEVLVNFLQSLCFEPITFKFFTFNLNINIYGVKERFSNFSIVS